MGSDCILLASKFKNETEVSHTYKEGKCLINVKSIFDSKNNVQKTLSQSIFRAVKNSFKEM